MHLNRRNLLKATVAAVAMMGLPAVAAQAEPDYSKWNIKNFMAWSQYQATQSCFVLGAVTTATTNLTQKLSEEIGILPSDDIARHCWTALNDAVLYGQAFFVEKALDGRVGPYRVSPFSMEISNERQYTHGFVGPLRRDNVTQIMLRNVPGNWCFPLFTPMSRIKPVDYTVAMIESDLHVNAYPQLKMWAELQLISRRLAVYQQQWEEMMQFCDRLSGRVEGMAAVIVP